MTKFTPLLASAYQSNVGIELLVFEMERCWATAMALRLEDEHRKRLHAIHRWRRAIKLGKQLIEILSTIECEGNRDIVLLQATTFVQWMQVQKAVDLRKDALEALEILSKLRTGLLKALASTHDKEGIELLKMRIEEIPVWRGFFESKLGSERRSEASGEEAGVDLGELHLGVVRNEYTDSSFVAKEKASAGTSKKNGELLSWFGDFSSGKLSFLQLHERISNKSCPCSKRLKKTALSACQVLKCIHAFEASMVSDNLISFILSAEVRSKEVRQKLVDQIQKIGRLASLLPSPFIPASFQADKKLFAIKLTNQIKLELLNGSRRFDVAAIGAQYPNFAEMMSKQLEQLAKANETLSEAGLKMTPLGPIPVSGEIEVDSMTTTDFIPAPLAPLQLQPIPAKPIFYDLAYDYLVIPTF